MWSWSAKRTLGVAQDLYDKFKLTTYPRTDSKHLPEDMHETVAKTLDQLSGQPDYAEHVNRLQSEGLSNAKRNFNNAKVSDHYAIVPTGQTPPKNFGGDHANCTTSLHEIPRILASACRMDGHQADGDQR